MHKTNSQQQKSFQQLSDILNKYQQPETNKYISHEFQDYGYRLAVELDDLAHKSLYIKLAKQMERGLLESARSFVIDSQAKSKGKLFMWKLQQLLQERKQKKAASSTQQPSLFDEGKLG